MMLFTEDWEWSDWVVACAYAFVVVVLVALVGALAWRIIS